MSVDERPSDTGVEVVLGCSSVRRVRVPDADSSQKLLRAARDGLSTEGELAQAFASLIHDDASKKTPAARNALLEALGGRYAARHPDEVPPSLTRWLHLTAALDARPAVARGALETLIEMDQRSLDEGIVDDVLALYVADADVPRTRTPPGASTARSMPGAPHLDTAVYQTRRCSASRSDALNLSHDERRDVEWRRGSSKAVRRKCAGGARRRRWQYRRGRPLRVARRGAALHFHPASARCRPRPICDGRRFKEKLPCRLRRNSERERRRPPPGAHATL